MWFRFCEVKIVWLDIFFCRVSPSKSQRSSDKAEIDWDLTDTTTSTPSNNDTINWNISLGTAKIWSNLIWVTLITPGENFSQPIFFFYFFKRIFFSQLIFQTLLASDVDKIHIVSFFFIFSHRLLLFLNHFFPQFFFP